MFCFAGPFFTQYDTLDYEMDNEAEDEEIDSEDEDEVLRTHVDQGNNTPGKKRE